MNRAAVGWMWVAGQAIILVSLILLPGRDDWATPSWVEWLANAVFFGGLVFAAVAAFGLGSALTPTPVPAKQGTLRTNGLYRFVRHPIYTGVLAVVVGITLRSGSWIKLAVAVLALVFFDRKAAWEETQLTARYNDYPDYAAATPKLLPRLRRGSQS